MRGMRTGHTVHIVYVVNMPRSPVSSSGLVISQADPQPLYLQVREQVRRRVALGDWPPGSVIPSIRALAAELGVSVITIKRAYLELEREGVIVTRQGKGSFVATHPGLGPRLRTAGLDHHLAEALRVGRAMGMKDAEVIDRLRELAGDTGQ